MYSKPLPPSKPLKKGKELGEKDHGESNKVIHIHEAI